jgi:hypothetical protein
MKLTFEILGILLAAFALYAGVRYLLERWRQQKVDREGVVVYATLISAEPVKWFGRPQAMSKILMRVQEPGETVAREVTITSRMEPKQKIEMGMRLPVVIDPKNPKRVYPASAEAAKRAVLTGSRQERRMMGAQIRNPRRGAGMRPPGGYQPPTQGRR